jgi:hypothetical protein
MRRLLTVVFPLLVAVLAYTAYWCVKIYHEFQIPVVGAPDEEES